MNTILISMIVATALTATEKKPNFVIMMTDDQRADALSCAGNQILKTPNIDRIASGGVRFTNSFVTNSLCGPSRATLLTGMYSHAHGVIDNTGRAIKKEQPILPDLLRQAGYKVAFCGKSHLVGALRDRKWDYYFGFTGQGVYNNPLIAEGTDGKEIRHNGYMDDITTGKAVEWLEKQEEPFCLFLFFKAPHRSWLRARRHQDLFRDAVIPKPDTFDDDLKGFPGKPKAFANADNRIGDFDDVRSLEGMVKDYYATLVAVDENVGRVLAALDRAGKSQETVVLFTSDNGFFHGEWRAYDKRFMHEPSIRVPMLVKAPMLGGSVGGTREEMVLNIDIAPTILDLAGAPVPSWMHGKSFAPIFKGQTPADWRKDWLYEYYEYPLPHRVKPHRGVRTEKYKFIHYYTDPVEYELYDLATDPGERNNLYGQPGNQVLVERLTRRLNELRKQTGDSDGVTADLSRPRPALKKNRPAAKKD